LTRSELLKYAVGEGTRAGGLNFVLEWLCYGGMTKFGGPRKGVYFEGSVGLLLGGGAVGDT